MMNIYRIAWIIPLGNEYNKIPNINMITEKLRQKG